jgi:hypothetical protein
MKIRAYRFNNNYPKLPFGHGRKGREGINGVGKVRRGYIVKFPHPMYFSLRWAKERSIRTWPSTVCPRNFVFWFSFLAGGAGTSLRPWTEGQRRYQRGGKGAKGLYC